MDLPMAVFLSTSVVTVGTLLLKYMPPAIAQATKRLPAGYVRADDPCILHSDILTRLSEGDKVMEELKRMSNRQILLSLAIASRLKVPIDDLRDELKDLLS